MAFLLRFDGADDNVDLASPISATGDGVLAEIDFEYQGALNDVICGGTSFSDFWRINGDTQFRISIAGAVTNVNINTPLVIGTRYVLRLVRTGSSVIVEDENGVALTPATNFNANPFIVDKIGSFHNGTSDLAMDLYGFKANNGASNYDPTASFDQGELVDTVAGNNGSPINFPTNFNDALIFYDDGGGTVEQQVTANESKQAAQSETQSVTFTQQAGSNESQQVSEADEKSASTTQVASSNQSQQLSQSQQQAASITQLLSILDDEQISESTQQTVQLAQQIQHNEAQQNTNADTQAVTLSQALQPIEVKQKAQAEQQTVQDGGGITANDAQQQSESEQQSITANQSVNSFEENQNVESVQATVTLAQQINAVEVEQFAQAEQSVITDGNGIVAVQVEQKAQAQVSEVKQTQQVSPFNVEQHLESEKALPAIIQRLLAVDAEQITQAPTLQVSDSDIIIDPQKISVERVTPTFTIQLVERPKYTIVRL